MSKSLFPTIGNIALVELATAELTKSVGLEIGNAVKTLLETKHLYQSVKVDLQALVQECCLRQQLGTEDAAHVAERVAKFRPSPAPVTAIERARVVTSAARFEYETPTWKVPDIKVFCNGSCGRVEPFNPSSSHVVDSEVIALVYLCQGCKAQTYTFLLSTSKNRVQLVGRNPMERVEVAKSLPKSVAKHFSDAKVAYQAGQPLAGLFLLRVFCEQWAREHAPEGIQVDRALDAYMGTLPDVLKQNFPSLKALYSDLSGAVHKAQADGALFERAAADIERHFEARKLFKLSAVGLQI